MCGRFTTTTSAAAIAAALEADECVADLPPRYNVAPTDEVYAVAEVDGRRRLGSCRWGLVPGWADDPSIGSRLINARAETVATTPAFRRSFAGGRRCLVPASGWFEWARSPGGAKQAWYLTPADGSVLAFAGLWASWRRDDRRIVSCTIVTAPAADDRMRALHDRMPVALPAEAWAAWLDPHHDDAEALTDLLRAMPPPLELRPVGPAVGSVANDHPGLLERTT